MQLRTRRSSALRAAAFAVLASAGAFGVGPSPSQQAKLVSPGAAGDETLGYSVAVSGDTLVAGAPGTDSYRGLGHVFARTGSSWTRLRMIENYGGKSPDQLGGSVAVSGDTALLGVRGANDGAGEAWVYTRTETSWAEQQQITGSDSVINNNFGYSVALQGDTAVVGALNNDSWRGAVYVFTRTGTTWTQEAKLVAADAEDHDQLGLSVAISGDTIVSGAYGTDAFRGAVYVFRRTGGEWAQEAKISAADGADSDTFGRSVSISGDALLVGTDAKDSRRGAAYVFRRTGTEWTQEDEFTLADGAEFDYFGNSVALAGDLAVVGAYGRNGRRGAVYVYGRSEGVWSQTAELTAADAAAADFFGFCVSVSGDTLAVGAMGKDGARGAAYVFTGFLPPSGYCLPAKVTAKANAKFPERSAVTASGTLDTGAGEPDFSGGATFDVGGFRLTVPAFVAKGRSLSYSEGGFSLTITPSRTGSSRAAFSAKVVGDFAGKVDRDGPLALRFTNAAHDLSGTAVLTGGALGPHCVTSPDLCVLKASAAVKGGGKDSFKLTLGFATDGTVPESPDDVTIAFGESFGSAVLPAASFVRKRSSWVFAGRAPGITSVVVDFAKGWITVAGSGLDLGSFTPGGNAVRIAITHGGETQSARVRMSLAGTKLVY